MSQIGLFLLVVSAALAVAEAHVPTHGALGGAAVVSLAAGIALVIGGAGVGPLLAVTTGLAVAAVGAVYLWIVVNKALAARRARVRSGPQGLIDASEFLNGKRDIDVVVAAVESANGERHRQATGQKPRKTL